MPTINHSYSPSVNIKRDRRKSLSYIPTPNSKEVANSIVGGLFSGSRSHVIVGAYGSGKSIFLWAFSKTLAQSKSYFILPPELESQKFHIINIVGEYRSLMEVFAEEFQQNKKYNIESILSAIAEEYSIQSQKGKSLLIIIDEFGKFLEYAAKFNPEEEIYFIQELAEFVNDEEKNILFLTTLHQNFNAYGFDLSKRQQNEWRKVQGRFKEITFNEPVEQLLFLASERLELEAHRKPHGFVSLFRAIKRSRCFPLRDYLTEDIAQKLYPLDILAAAILTLALQRYGQNERSLFSFLESPDHLGLNKERDGHFYSVPDVYDYLKYSFSIINTKHNPHYVQWASIASNLERAEGIFDEDLKAAEGTIKTIGLLNTFGSGSMVLDDKFLQDYGKYSLGIKKIDPILQKLVDNRLIRYTQYNRRYVLFDGTDLDIELAIDEAGNLIERVANVVAPLKEYFDFQVILAKSAYYQKGTPRFFEYIISDELKEHRVIGEIDGIINLIFSEHITIKELKAWAAKTKRPVIYGLYENTGEIQKLIFEIRKVEKVIENHQEDRVAVRELKNILEHQRKLLNHFVLDNFSKSEGVSVRWVDFDGEHIIKNERGFNQRLSIIADKVYSETPVFSSELINRTKLSGAIRSAQKNFMRHMVNYYSALDWNFEQHLFPPEKTIFLSLVKDKGIVTEIGEDELSFQKPTDPSFTYLWNTCVQFLESTKTGKRSVREFAELLLQPPLKLKNGFIQFWLPLFLFIKRNDFALYEGDIFIPVISDETLEIVLKHSHKYYVKAFQVEGVDLELFQRYRRLLNQSESLPTNEAFIETVRPFLSFYRSLTEYSRNTERISTDAFRVREVIARTKDPEAMFFKSLPAALDTTKKELAADADLAIEYIDRLQSAITEIRTSYDDLVSRFFTHIREFTGYENPKKGLETRFSNLQVALLSKKQNVFYQRLLSDLDQTSWLSSLCQSLIGKTLDRINAEEEAKLYQAFISTIEELDNITALSGFEGIENNDHEYVLVDIQSATKGRTRQVVQLSKKKRKKIQKQKEDILAVLGTDKSVLIAAFTELLNDLINE